ncbi:unnamed protein product [Allacma fusca]|uniref:Geranylgeranyl pyrophosphate synthase n=1 Tax=Allacma fusca TaxID=39272 RepID=A0A8J2L6K8_9HEXA|nr:unnamed protein product [Allacma fusca]
MEEASLAPKEVKEVMEAAVVAANRPNNNSTGTGSASGDVDDKILLQPFDYIRSLPGKNVRSKLAIAFNHWLKVTPETLNKVCDVVELLHNSSLLIDDIEDGSELRRGQPVAHAIYGIPQTINAANYVYFIALERVLSLNHARAVDVFSAQLLELHRGQGMEIYWRDTFQCPTEEQYRKTIVKKTGGLFMLAIRLLQLFSDDQRDLKQLVSLLGLFFQIRDDYANLKLAEYCENKSYCEDLTEGKFSFPVIHAIHKYPEDTQISCILKQRTKNNDLKRYFVSLLEKFGSFAYTLQALQRLEVEIRDEIQALGGNPYLVTLLDELSSCRKFLLSGTQVSISVVISLIIVDISHGVSSGRDGVPTTKKNMEFKRIHASGPIRQETVFAARGPRHPTPIRVLDASSKIRTIRMASPECQKGMSQSMATQLPGDITVFVTTCGGQLLPEGAGLKGQGVVMTPTLLNS